MRYSDYFSLSNLVIVGVATTTVRLGIRELSALQVDKNLVFFGTTVPGLSLCHASFVGLSYTLVICDHTFQPIETILVSLESPNILVSEKVSLVQINSPKFGASVLNWCNERTSMLGTPGD